MKHIHGGGFYGDCCSVCLKGVSERWMFEQCSGDYIEYNNPYSDLTFALYMVY